MKKINVWLRLLFSLLIVESQAASLKVSNDLPQKQTFSLATFEVVRITYRPLTLGERVTLFALQRFLELIFCVLVSCNTSRIWYPFTLLTINHFVPVLFGFVVVWFCKLHLLGAYGVLLVRHQSGQTPSL